MDPTSRANDAFAAPPGEVILYTEASFSDPTDLTLTIEVSSGTLSPAEGVFSIKDGSTGTLTASSAWVYALTVPAHTSFLTLEFLPRDPDEEDEILTLTLSSVTPSRVGADYMHTIMITDTLDDHGDTRQAATVVGVASPGAALTSPGVLSPDDTDYFVFTPSEPGLVVVYTTGSTDTQGLLAETSQVVGEDDNSGTDDNFRIYLSVLTAGVPCFIRVQGADASRTRTLHPAH